MHWILYGIFMLIFSATESKDTPTVVLSAARLIGVGCAIYGVIKAEWGKK